MQITFNDENVKGDILQGLKDFNSQSLATKAMKREQRVSMMPAIKNAFDLMGDDIVEVSEKRNL